MHPAEHSPLGKQNIYVDQYTPELLYPIARSVKWKELGVDVGHLPYQGVDIWNAYELSWLTASGKPKVMAAQFVIPADSPFIIESKSFKLYLNSLNQTVFASDEALLATLEKDLTRAAGKRVQVNLYSLDQLAEQGLTKPRGICIDELEVNIHQYQHPDASLLKATLSATSINETLYSQLLKSNCPVTGQPDWGTLVVNYQGQQALDHAALLQYIVSFRCHTDFHEQCVERIFLDLKHCLQPDQLTVYARYIRRGGLDINPYRSLHPTHYETGRLARQ